MKTLRLSLLMGLVLLLFLTACSANSSGGDGAGTREGDQKKEPPVKLVFAFLNTGTMTDMKEVQEAINVIAREKINVEVELMPIDSSAWQQQANLLLSGNEQLDLMTTMAGLNYSSQVAKGQLLPLDDLLDQYGQGIRDALEPEILEGTKVNGKTYGVSSFREMAADYGFIARKDLLNKYKIDLSQVKAYEDLEPIFKIIKDNEPGIIPLVQRSNTNTIANELISSKIDSLGDGLGVLVLADDNTHVVDLYETDAYRQAVETARKWYQAGYIMKDASTTQESNVALVKAGRGFGYLSNMKPGFEFQETNLTGYEMEAVRITPVIGGSTGPAAFMVSIPRNSKHPEAAMKFMNLLYTNADIMNLLTLGIEGKHYVKNADGTIKPPVGDDIGYVLNQWEIGNNALTHVWEGWDPNHWEEMKAFNRKAVYSKGLGFMFNSEGVKAEIASVNNVVDKYRAGLGSGSLDPAGNLDKFIKELKSAGIDKIIAEKQRQMDEWLATKK
ncbi:ABC transporter substrate-binding protein [Paenibacillus sp. VMFN-D1]|uniref:ABC transporter substrate-binding protein n=1 Tax=Paenibacillus sp. VMFN-D1 TaxID=2135608 RepID=UPI000E26A2EC|nr:ABC transporter substrate-binding protein [Paenibacillus sp. VMFN-D1]RED41831.1 putative aldouronate transport system substrate-binding protein [Paenibacillus sp. VMFN-D1]